MAVPSEALLLESAMERAYVTGDYEKLLSDALSTGTADKRLYMGRAQTYLKAERNEEAREDAREVLKEAPTELAAYMVIGTASFRLGEFEEALKAFQMGKSHIQGRDELRFGQWVIWTEERIQRLEYKLKESSEAKAAASANEEVQLKWVQSPSKVTISVLPKKSTFSNVKVVLEHTKMIVSADLATGSIYYLNWYLAYPITVDESSYEVTTEKVLVSLKKEEEGVLWSSLKTSKVPPEALQQAGSSQASQELASN